MPDINTDSFLNELNKAAAKIGEDYEKFVRKVCWDLFNVIRTRWAFDTRLSLNNWHIQAGQPDKTIYPNQPQQQDISSFPFKIEDGAIYITNNIFYVEFLELNPTVGKSSVPNKYHGTIRIALTEFEDLMRQYAAGATP